MVEADVLAAAPVIEDWSWSLTGTADLYVKGVVDGRPWTTAEVREVARSARWVRDADGVLWRLGTPADDEPPAITESCGCVFCDLLLPIDEWIDGVPYHRARGGELIECRSPRSKAS